MKKDSEKMLFTRRDIAYGVTSFAALASLMPLPVRADIERNKGATGDSISARASNICQQIEYAVQLALKRSTAKYPLAQAGAVMHVLQNLNLGLAMNYVNSDPARPTIFNYMGPHVKQGGDNADAFYSGFAVDHRNTYRLYGKLGTAAYVSITTVERNDSTPWGGRMGEGLYGHLIETAPDGSFEIIISATENKGNWLKITERDFRVTIRQFFGDWEREEPMRATVELVGPSKVPPLEYSAEHVMDALEASAMWTETTVQYWQDVMDLFRKTPNQFQRWRDLTKNAVNATPGGEPENCFWSIPVGKALIMRVRPPKCLFWNVEFNNPWWETMDYRFYLSGTNHHYATLEEDGELIVVAAHSDPGVPNWLDTCGHTEGMMGRRWMFSETQPKYETRLVDHDQLFSVLPKSVQRITAEQRTSQLRRRKNGLYKRFGTL